MPKTHSFDKLREELEARPGHDQLAAEVAAEIAAEDAAYAKSLKELRRARHFTQVQLATTLGTTQPSVSEIENRSDLYLSTLRSYVEAMGGHLVVSAEFNDATVTIDTFHDLNETGAA